MDINETIDNVISEYFQDDDYKNYLKWKRKNVTIRGIRDINSSTENNSMASFGAGLYTAFLSNKELAKKYGDVYFVVNAMPKHPMVVNSWNEAEIAVQQVIIDYCKDRNMGYNPTYFYNNTTIPEEMNRLGYDGLVIRGREMVNYNPDMEKIKYYKNEDQLYDHYRYTVKGV